jgi:alcohol dehydrogenase class IV
MPVGRFEFATASRIVFGAGTVKDLGELAKKLGCRALLVTNRLPGEGTLLDRLEEQGYRIRAGLAAHSIDFTEFAVEGEPTIDQVRVATRLAAQEAADLVIGIGGGSAMDTAKAIAALQANGGDPLDYVEVIGQGKPLQKPSLPCIAVPTTAGTGAEVTRNAVLAAPSQGVKVSMRSPTMLPALALVDPELTYPLPPAVTASTGLDALTQVLEPFVSSRANPLVDALCREGLVRASRSLRRACERGEDAAAREDLSLASLLGGLALANAGLGAVHGFASVLGGMYRAPHGAICACLLPPVMEINLRALHARAPDHPALARYTEIAGILTGLPDASALEGAAWVRDLVAALQIPGLGSYGLTSEDFPGVVAKTQAASSTKANPIRLLDGELEAVLALAL